MFASNCEVAGGDPNRCAYKNPPCPADLCLNCKEDQVCPTCTTQLECQRFFLTPTQHGLGCMTLYTDPHHHITELYRLKKTWGEAMRIVGSWTKIGSSAVPHKLTYTYGTTWSNSTTDTNSSSQSTTKKLSLGFEAEGFSLGIEISQTTAQEFSHTYSSTISHTITKSEEFDFPAGVYWQWQFEVYDACGDLSTVLTTDVTVTESIPKKPCCLPGYFKNITDPNGECVKDPDGKLVNLCE